MRRRDVGVIALIVGVAFYANSSNFSARERKRDALDKLIAAHAIALDATLVTNNEADFAGYPGLRVENWVIS